MTALPNEPLMTDPRLTRYAALRPTATDPCDDCQWEPGGEPCSFHADEETDQ